MVANWVVELLPKPGLMEYINLLISNLHQRPIQQNSKKEVYLKILCLPDWPEDLSSDRN